MSEFLSTSELDFSQLKASLKTYLKNQSVFQDLDFEGSNLNVLLDVLAYNTYLNAYYLNVVGSESFLDSAKLRDTVSSHAKELNYVPRSKTSARAYVSLTATSSNPDIGQVIVPKYTKFTATGVTANSISSQFTFLTDDDVILNRISNTQFQANTYIYEGTIVREKFAVTDDPYQRFVISNKDVDTASIKVSVQTSNIDTSNAVYTKTDSLFGLSNTSTVYFVQSAYNDKYELLFGDNVFGKKPISPNIINVEYRVTNGELANGSRLFRIGTFTDSTLYPTTTTTLVNATAGADRETVESIKFNAPRHFQTQYRAVTAEDYKTLIKAKFNEISAVNAYGGETLPQPEYGRVYISAATTTGSYISETTKQAMLDYLKTRGPLSLDLRYIDPSFLDLIITTNVLYNTALTNLTNNQIRQLVYNSISSFNSANLLDFDKDFRFSKFVHAIDNSDRSIIGNSTDIMMVKTVVPFLSVSTSFIVDFKNSIQQDDIVESRPKTNLFTLYSSAFTYENSTSAYFGEDGGGKIIVYEDLSSGRNVLNDNVGTINYQTGLVSINDIIIDNYTGDGISFFAVPSAQDIFANRDTIMRVNLTRLNINVTAQ